MDFGFVAHTCGRKSVERVRDIHELVGMGKLRRPYKLRWRAIAFDNDRFFFCRAALLQICVPVGRSVCDSLKAQAF